MIRQGLLEGLTHEEAVKNYIKAAVKGVVKVISKMGISTIQSYRGAQIFEAIGLNHPVIDKYFTWTPSRVEGIGLEDIAREVLHSPSAGAFPIARERCRLWTLAGNINGAAMANFICSIPRRFTSCSRPVGRAVTRLFKEYSALVNNQAEAALHVARPVEFQVRGASRFRLEEVEPVESIVKRFQDRAPCPTDRSARKRTKPWPSP